MKNRSTVPGSRPRVAPAMVLAALGLAPLIASGCRRADRSASGEPGTAARPDIGRKDAPAQAVPVAPGPAAPAPTPAVTINAGQQGALFHVQIAGTPEERANGLVGRPTLASDAGLLLVFDGPGMQAVDLRTTLISIDLIFIGPNRRVVGIIERAKPGSTAKVRVGVASQYVLEVGGGLAGRLGVRVGQSVDFQAIPGT